jgi:hypothetical protein
MRTVAAFRSKHSATPDRGLWIAAGATGACGGNRQTGTNQVRFRSPAAELQMTPVDVAARRPSCAHSDLPPCSLTPSRHLAAGPATLDSPKSVELPSWAARAGAAVEAGWDVYAPAASQCGPRPPCSSRRRPQSVKPICGSRAVPTRCRRTYSLESCSRPPALRLEPRPADRPGEYVAAAAHAGRAPLAPQGPSPGVPARSGPGHAAAAEVGKRTVRLSRRKVFNEKRNADQRPPARREPHRHR